MRVDRRADIQGGVADRRIPGCGALVVLLLLVVGATHGCRRNDDAVDLKHVTSHSELYLRSRVLSAKLVERSKCSVESSAPSSSRTGAREAPRLRSAIGDPSDLIAQYEQHRYLNFIPNSAKGEPEHRRWSPASDSPPEEQGTYEVTIFPCAKPSQEQTARAEELLSRSLDAAIRHGWFDFSRAVADGFRLSHPGEAVHYVHEEFVADDEVLSPDKPEFLVFYERDGDPLLAGFMYMLPGIEDRGPQIGGPFTVWHYHILNPFCYEKGLATLPGSDGRCDSGTLATQTPEMLHVWFFEREGGPFASDMTLPKGFGRVTAGSCCRLPEKEAGAPTAD